jgi:hypothetical protein
MTASSTIHGIAYTMRDVPQFHFHYEPQPDITTYELALLVPHLQPMIYGPEASSGSVLPLQHRRGPGWPIGGVILRLADYEIERLGTAMRHLRKLP